MHDTTLDEVGRMAEPEDLEEDERDMYDLFSTLREHVLTLFDDLSVEVFATIEHQQADRDRLRPPDPVDVLTQGLEQLADFLTRLTGGDDDPDARDDDPEDDGE